MGGASAGTRSSSSMLEARLKRLAGSQEEAVEQGPSPYQPEILMQLECDAGFRSGNSRYRPPR